MSSSEFGTVFMWAFFAIIGLFILLVFLLRFARRGSILGSLASTFQGGIPIIDKAGYGEIGELLGFEKNDETGKIRLRLNYIDKFKEGQTPFVFDEEDFDPAPKQIQGNWDNYHGNIILFKDFEGRDDYRGTYAVTLTRQLKNLKKQVAIYKRMGHDLINYFEKTKVPEARIGENIEGAKLLKGLRNLVKEENIDEVTPGAQDDGMFG